MKSFYVEEVANLNHLYLERFLSVIIDNQMESIIDKDFYIYVKKWLKFIQQVDFQSREINAEILRQIFRLIGVLARNDRVPFDRVIIEELAENMFRRALKIKENLGETFSVISEFVCRALSKYCMRTTKNGDKVASLLYSHSKSPFMRDLIDEINVDQVELGTEEEDPQRLEQPYVQRPAILNARTALGDLERVHQRKSAISDNQH